MNQSKIQSEMLDVWEVAEYLGITEPAARRLIRDGIIPIVKVGGKARSRIRVRRSDLDALIEASTTPATSGPLAGGAA